MKALILYDFHPKYYIKIKTNTFSHTIDRILRQLVFNNKSLWYLITFFFNKIIPI